MDEPTTKKLLVDMVAATGRQMIADSEAKSEGTAGPVSVTDLRDAPAWEAPPKQEVPPNLYQRALATALVPATEQPLMSGNAAWSLGVWLMPSGWPSGCTTAACSAPTAPRKRCPVHDAARPRARYASDGRAAQRPRHRGQAQPQRGPDGGAGAEVGMAEYFQLVESTDHEACTFETKRKGAPQAAETQLHHRAGEQGRTPSSNTTAEGSNWQKIPKQMLRARAKSELARLEYPDLLAGLYTPEELRDAKVEVA